MPDLSHSKSKFKSLAICHFCRVIEPSYEWERSNGGASGKTVVDTRSESDFASFIKFENTIKIKNYSFH